MRAQLDLRRDLAQQLLRQRARRQQLPQRPGVGGEVRAALGCRQVAPFGRRVQQKARQRRGLFHRLAEGLGALGADEAVGVVLGRQEQEFDGAHVGGEGQGGFQRLAGGAAPCGVAVEAEHHLLGEAEQLLHMLRRAGRAQRGHGVGEAQLRQGDHVHVALGHQGVAVLAQGGAGLEQAVQLAPLVEHRGLGRVEVLGLLVAQHAAAEADHLALDRADREHDAVAEAVVALAFLFLADDDQAALGQQRIGVVREHAGQAAPALGRIAQAEVARHLARQAAPLQVVDGAGRVLEVLAVGLAGPGQHVGQGGTLFALARGALALGRAALVFRHLHAILLREIVHHLHEAGTGVVHEEADGVAVLAAAEAVVELLGRADGEAGRLFRVERAQARKVGPGLLQLHVAADDVHDVGAGEKLLDEVLGDGHAAILPWPPGPARVRASGAGPTARRPASAGPGRRRPRRSRPSGHAARPRSPGPIRRRRR